MQWFQSDLTVPIAAAVRAYVELLVERIRGRANCHALTVDGTRTGLKIWLEAPPDGLKAAAPVGDDLLWYCAAAS